MDQTLPGAQRRDGKRWRYWRYISAIFLAGANFWAILGNFWAILAILGPLWAILGNFWAILGHFSAIFPEGKAHLVQVQT